MTPERAIKLLAAGDTIHTLRATTFGLVGCDVSRERAEQMIREAKFLSLAGATAARMGHGLAVGPCDPCTVYKMTFLATDPAELARAEQEVPDDPR